MLLPFASVVAIQKHSFSEINLQKRERDRYLTCLTQEKTRIIYLTFRFSGVDPNLQKLRFGSSSMKSDFQVPIPMLIGAKF